MALNSLFCADVLLRNYSHSLTLTRIAASNTASDDVTN